MSFDRLLGNEQLKKNLERSLAAGHISHFYLISGPEGSGKKTLARLLAAGILCRGTGRPCLSCPACRKVLSDAHPDFITVDDPEKKTVSVSLVREARSDMYLRPNEAEHKIYLFPRAEDMGLPGQNALLKVLEEPPAYGVFLLLADNPNRLLPTVRSRCTELRLQPLTREVSLPALRQEFPLASPEDLTAAVTRSGGFLGQAKKLLQDGTDVSERTGSFVRALCGRDALLLVQTLSPMEKWKRDPLADELTEWLRVTQAAFGCRSGVETVSPAARQLAAARSPRELLGYVETLQKALAYTRANVSPGAVCGYLAWKLR